MMRPVKKLKCALALLALAGLYAVAPVAAQIPLDAELGRDVAMGRCSTTRPMTRKR